MNDTDETLNPSPREKGFTLIEVLIVMSMIGLLSVTLAAVFTVIVRTTPDAEARITDARSLKGLVTWIPQDMDATPPGGFDDSHDAWPCSGPKPVDSHNVIAMAWTEKGDATTAFAASYRYERRGSDWVIARYTCKDAGPAGRVNMTSALPAWSSSSPPAWVEMCSAPIDALTGDCPSGSEVSDPSTEPVESMKVTVTLIAGNTYTIDAAAKNPDENLADDPDAVTNYPPVAGVSNVNIDMVAGVPTELDLYATHLISDPEVNFLTSAVDSYEPMPPGIAVTSLDTLKVKIVADSSAAIGPLPEPVSLIVSDSYGGSVSVTVTITIVVPPNVAPTASSLPYTLVTSESESRILPLDLTHGVSDSNGDALTLEVLTWPASLVEEPQVGAPLGELQMRVTVLPGAIADPAAEPIRVRVNDNRGGSIEVLTFVNIVAPVPNSSPIVTPFGNPAASMAAGASATRTVVASDVDGDALWVVLDGLAPAGLTVTTSGLDVTITADGSIVVGSYVVPLRVYDGRGGSAPISASVQIVPPPPPPPPTCVLGGLTADRNPVARSGSGGGPKALVSDVLITLTYSGNCDGLVLKYDTGHTSGLGSGVGRVFPSGSPTTIKLLGDIGGGSEKWVAGTHVLTASTTSAVSPNSVMLTLTVT